MKSGEVRPSEVPGQVYRTDYYMVTSHERMSDCVSALSRKSDPACTDTTGEHTVLPGPIFSDKPTKDEILRLDARGRLFEETLDQTMPHTTLHHPLANF